MIVMAVSASTIDVFTLNCALVAPAGTVTVPGACPAVLFDQTETTAPPVGAAPVRVTVPVTALPPGINAEPRLIDLTEMLPTNGFEATNASAWPLVSLDTRLAATDANAT